MLEVAGRVGPAVPHRILPLVVREALPTTAIGDETAMIECGDMMMPPVVSDSALCSCGGN